MPEVLHAVARSDRVHTLAGPAAVLDAATSAVLDAAMADAAASAYRDGEAAGRTAAADEAARAVAAVVDAVARLRHEIREQLAAATERNLEFAQQVATGVLERVPPDDALTVLDRVRRVLDTLDDPALEVRLNPTDRQVLREAGAAGFELVADATLAPGEARISGVSAGADLTRGALVAAAVQVLAEERP